MEKLLAKMIGVIMKNDHKSAKNVPGTSQLLVNIREMIVMAIMANTGLTNERIIWTLKFPVGLDMMRNLLITNK